ncbi:rhodanese-like domain-containing protein [Streptomyces sp. NPDC088757]|uniref:rhodanese-like domain-containing protein n=1 Tax=Streptomyces sp. NPDC088757 TaxID=3365889 RepID=UPI0038278DE3
MSDHDPYESLADTRGRVLGVPAEEPGAALEYFCRTRLGHETDAYDVRHDMAAGLGGFVVLDVRREDAYRQEHIEGARHFSHHDMTRASVDSLDPAPVYVTYGWGPGCNAAVKGAAKLAARGLRVKEMIGGLEYWKRQGFPTSAAPDPESEAERAR